MKQDSILMNWSSCSGAKGQCHLTAEVTGENTPLAAEGDPGCQHESPKGLFDASELNAFSAHCSIWEISMNKLWAPNLLCPHTLHKV